MDMKRKAILTFLTLAMLASCGGAKASSDSVASTSITDANGRKVEIKSGGYRKIVCIGAGALRMYSYVGESSWLAGVEDIDNLDAEGRPAMFDGVARPYFIANQDSFRGLASCGKGGPAAQAAEAEKILSCKPDLVISEYEDVEKADALQKQLGIPVITLKYGAKGVFDQAALDSISLIGKVIGREEKANALLSYIDTATKDLAARTQNLTSEKKAYICGLGNWGTTNHLMTAKNFEPFNVAHITNIADSLLSNPGIQSIDKENLVSAYKDIDVMFVDAAAVKNIRPLYAEDPTMFEGCKAVASGEVYLLMAYNAYYTNLEINLANTYYSAKVYYPEAFADIDIKAKLNEITRVFNGKELANEIYQYPQSFGGYQKISVEALFGGTK